jgi:hypothetical protein
LSGPFPRGSRLRSANLKLEALVASRVGGHLARLPAEVRGEKLFPLDDVRLVILQGVFLGRAVGRRKSHRLKPELRRQKSDVRLGLDQVVLRLKLGLKSREDDR